MISLINCISDSELISILTRMADSASILPDRTVSLPDDLPLSVRMRINKIPHIDKLHLYYTH